MDEVFGRSKVIRQPQVRPDVPGCLRICRACFLADVAQRPENGVVHGPVGDELERDPLPETGTRVGERREPAPEAFQGVLEARHCPGLVGVLCGVLELTVDDFAGLVWSRVTVVLGDVNHVLARRVIARLLPVGGHGILRRGALDRHCHKPAAGEQHLEALPRCPVVMKLVPVTARPHQVSRAHEHGLTTQAASASLNAPPQGCNARHR
jgi:hypothetical protein